MFSLLENVFLALVFIYEWARSTSGSIWPSLAFCIRLDCKLLLKEDATSAPPTADRWTTLLADVSILNFYCECSVSLELLPKLRSPPRCKAPLLTKLDGTFILLSANLLRGVANRVESAAFIVGTAILVMGPVVVLNWGKFCLCRMSF